MTINKNLIADQDWDFKVLKRQILKDRGFDCNQYRDNYVKRRLAIRMRANNVDSYKDYAILLKRDPTEYDELIEALTITVSEFFRDASVFDSGKYRVSDKIKGMVKFEKHDLVSGKPLAHFDVIFCRNVSIYFSRNMHEKLYMDFYNALNNDGFFVMGKTEMLCGNARKLFIPVNAREGIYQKKVAKEDRECRMYDTGYKIIWI